MLPLLLQPLADIAVPPLLLQPLADTTGDATPSLADVAFTDALQDAAVVQDVLQQLVQEVALQDVGHGDVHMPLHVAAAVEGIVQIHVGIAAETAVQFLQGSAAIACAEIERTLTASADMAARVAQQTAHAS